MAEKQQYKVHSGMPVRLGTCVAREGIITPGGLARGREYEWDKAKLKRIASNYDPAGVYCATWNSDHMSWWGPSWGLTLALRYEEKDGEGLLLADIATPPEISEQIDLGMWPHRSLEWNDALLAAEVYEREAERYFFYGKFDLYHTGGAYLGQAEPAVPGLGQWPEASYLREEAELLVPADYAAAAAASAEARPRIFMVNPHKEEPMSGSKTNAARTSPEKEKVEAAKEPPELTAPEEDAGLQAENARLRQELEAGQAERDASARQQERSQAEQDREENARLKAQVAAMNRAADLDALTAELKASGHIVPGNSAQFAALAEQLHGLEPATLTARDGSQSKAAKSPLAALREFVEACGPQISYREVAAEQHGKPGGAAGEITEADKAEAARLGVHPLVYAHTHKGHSAPTKAQIEAYDKGGQG